MYGFYSSANYIEKLVESFNTKTLAKDKWTHTAHLTVAIWHLKNYSFDEALPRVRQGITEYNVAVGTQNTATGGYHETMTVFWMTVAYFFVQKNKSQPLKDVCNALLASPLAARDLPFYFYEKATILSLGARAAFVSPDNALLDDVALGAILQNVEITVQ
jgi:hypothetical protein